MSSPSCCLVASVSVRANVVALQSPLRAESLAVSISIFCLFNVLAEVLLKRNLHLISDQLLASKTSNDCYRHALFQVPLCVCFACVFDGLV